MPRQLQDLPEKPRPERFYTKGIDVEKEGVGAEHTNSDFMGFCCPHCYEDNENVSTGYDPTAHQCEHCGEWFAVWKEKVVEHKSSFIDHEETVGMHNFEDGQ